MLLGKEGMTRAQFDDMGIRKSASMSRNYTGHKLVATSHILLSVMRVSYPSRSFLSGLGIKYDELEEFIKQMKKPGPSGIGSRFMYTQGALDVLDKGASLAEEYDFRNGQHYTDYLVAALHYVADADFILIMDEYGVKPDALSVAVKKRLNIVDESVNP